MVHNYFVFNCTKSTIDQFVTMAAAKVIFPRFNAFELDRAVKPPPNHGEAGNTCHKPFMVKF